VLGDHGQDLHHTTFRANEWLAAEGYLRWAGDGVDVDWATTRAYATGNYIHLNLLGREPTGIVTASEAERVRESLVSRLLDLRDEATGERPVLIAGDKREFEFLGGDGAGVGDVVFCLRSGYQATNDRGEIFTPTKVFQEFTSGHDHFWPLDPRIHTRLFAAGSSFRQGYEHKRAAHLVDVAPTVCAALGIEPPAHCQGHVMQKLLADEAEEAMAVGVAAQGVTLGL
jgi:predicted AlkP superfamily phosphohydrolase/phosphomutase